MVLSVVFCKGEPGRPPPPGHEPIVFRMPPPEPDTDSTERSRKAAKRATREESRFHSGEIRILQQIYRPLCTNESISL